MTIPQHHAFPDNYPERPLGPCFLSHTELPSFLPRQIPPGFLSSFSPKTGPCLVSPSVPCLPFADQALGIGRLSAKPSPKRGTPPQSLETELNFFVGWRVFPLFSADGPPYSPRGVRLTPFTDYSNDSPPLPRNCPPTPPWQNFQKRNFWPVFDGNKF